MSDIFAPLPDFRFDVIVADPPWLTRLYSAKGEAKAPQAHYRCLPIETICTLPVQTVARADCWLFLWTSAPLLDRAFEVLNAWGFAYCSRIAWRKTTKGGAQRTGPGFVVRTQHEDILIGKRGRPLYSGAIDSLIEAGLFDGVARGHSQKPDEFYELIEKFLPDAWRLELFSRLDRPGWTAWGDEAGKLNDV